MGIKRIAVNHARQAAYALGRNLSFQGFSAEKGHYDVVPQSLDEMLEYIRGEYPDFEVAHIERVARELWKFKHDEILNDCGEDFERVEGYTYEGSFYDNDSDVGKLVSMIVDTNTGTMPVLVFDDVQNSTYYQRRKIASVSIEMPNLPVVLGSRHVPVSRRVYLPELRENEEILNHFNELTHIRCKARTKFDRLEELEQKVKGINLHGGRELTPYEIEDIKAYRQLSEEIHAELARTLRNAE